MNSAKLLLARFSPFFLTFLAVETFLRGALLIREWGQLEKGITLLKMLASGLAYDFAVFAYFLPLFLFCYLFIPAKHYGKTPECLVSTLLYGLFTYGILFSMVGEWLFWDEFSSRYNFIAVDYLVYMDEVVGNIRESYPVLPIMLAIGIASATLSLLFYRKTSPSTPQPLAFTSRKRAAAFAVSLGMATVSFNAVSLSLAEVSTNHYNNEIASNGIFSLFSAFRHNELSYKDFYIVENKKKVLAGLRNHLRKDGLRFVDGAITRRTEEKGKETHPNIVLITVESLSAEYLGAFGNKDGLTPNLDRLAKESLFFTNLYATGTRTVYGLSAITLSIPPIPGNAIARRPENEHLFSLASVLNAKGYESKFIYGGFGYFDNMNYFFGNNGYKIVDRSQFAKDEITFANIWGVSDEDLYNKTLKENDKAYKKGKPFFDMLMTTSNHQPFTYPDGRIDIPSPGKRSGGVKYTDYAIGKFLADAKKHPWFDNTIFVIVADHTAGSSGKLELTPEAYHIPMIFYAPGLIKPQEVALLSSQIDLAPTLLGLMDMDYESRFYGKDILKGGEERAFIANYQHVGLLTKDKLVVLKPVKDVSVYEKKDNEFAPAAQADQKLIDKAVAYFQNAAEWRKYNQAIKRQVVFQGNKQASKPVIENN